MNEYYLALKLQQIRRDASKMQTFIPLWAFIKGKIDQCKRTVCCECMPRVQSVRKQSQCRSCCSCGAAAKVDDKLEARQKCLFPNDWSSENEYPTHLSCARRRAGNVSLSGKLKSGLRRMSCSQQSHVFAWKFYKSIWE